MVGHALDTWCQQDLPKNVRDGARPCCERGRIGKAPDTSNVGPQRRARGATTPKGVPQWKRPRARGGGGRPHPSPARPRAGLLPPPPPPPAELPYTRVASHPLVMPCTYPAV